MKILLDTNIVIDILDDRRIGNSAILLLLEQEDMQFFMVADTLLTIKYIFRKTNNLEAIEMISSLCDVIEILDTDKKSVLEALDISYKCNYDDLEDIAKLIIATKNECDIFVSEDKKIPYIDGYVPVNTVEEVLKILGYEKDLFGEWNSSVEVVEDISKSKFLPMDDDVENPLSETYISKEEYIAELEAKLADVKGVSSREIEALRKKRK